MMPANAFALVAPEALSYAAIGAAVVAAVLGLLAWLAARGAAATAADRADEILRRLQQATAGAQAAKDVEGSLVKLHREVQTVATRLDELGERLEHQMGDLGKALHRGGTTAKAAPAHAPEAAAPAAKPAPPPTPAKPPPAPAKPAPPPAAAKPAPPTPPAPAPPPVAVHRPEPAAPKPEPAARHPGSETIDFEQDNGVLLVRVHYREVKRPEAQELVNGVFERTETKEDRVLLDLSNTAYVNSSGLSAITKIAVERNCRLVLTADDVIKVMDLMGFLPLLTICATEDEARRSFAEP